MSFLSRSLRTAGALALLGCAACRAQDPPPEGARGAGSTELIGPVVNDDVRLLPPATTAPAAATPAPAPTLALTVAAEGWNTAHIDWQPYEAGLARAKKQKKPVCLVLYTGWCPHCRNYSHVFEDPQVVERAKDFVMIRANADDEPAVASKFVPDGGYVPRTFFLSSDGTLDPEIHAARPKFLYFYDERAPHSLLAGMAQAKAKLAK